MKNFIKIVSFVLSLAVILCCVGCAGDANSDAASVENSSVSASDTQSETASDSTQSETTSGDIESETTSCDTVSRQPTQEQLNCSHEYTSSITKYPRVLDEGETTYMCKLCEYSYIEKIPKTKTLKVLALGNSFSCDAMEYLWDIADNAGVENIVLGNINISACSLDMYLEYIWDDSTHNYRKNTDGTWKDRTFTVADVLADEEWDIISLQQASKHSAVPETYDKLNKIVDYISNSNPDARIVWHLTWSYQHNDTHEIFKEYDRDPVKMYNAIVSTYKSEVMPNSKITAVIPGGTAVQNLRSSYFGDTITRDGFHMSYNYGRYLVALTWFATLTGGDVNAVTWIPNEYPEVAPDIDVIRQSVKDAIKTPFAITQQTKER